jgi:cobalamin synthase
VQYIESDTLVFVSVVVLLGWICWLYFRRRQMLSEMKKMQLQMASSALDKFGSAGEFVAFLQSKEGKAMLYDFTSPAVSRSRTNMRLVQAGIILTFVGAGLFIATFLIPVMQGDQAKEVMALLIFSGTVAISMAVGLWVTALVTALCERRTGGSEGDQV